MTLIIYLLNIKSAVTIYFELAAREGGRGVGMSLFLDFKKNIYLREELVCLGTISLGRVAVPSSKIVINLPRTYEKLHCKGEPYWISG